MSDPVLEKALARRAEIQAKLDDLDRWIETYKELKGESEAKKRFEVAASEFVSAANMARHGLTPPDHRSATQKTLDTVAEILTRENRPMRPAELVLRLEELGIHLSGKNPANNLSAMLSGAKQRFKSLGHGEGWIVLGKGTIQELFRGD
ncbi:hypothetical protein SVA_0444 [Sulfurifustis variabilis]|uniref:HTH HARE-type domain-containing protein n=2 Tax=Sulfurifustis variabilis TaxID=1675686 RepID=A0A1B4V186_9GAMM|nr:hypothetical protein SVA_0444 [Sulfurifustis variabilis]